MCQHVHCSELLTVILDLNSILSLSVSLKDLSISLQSSLSFSHFDFLEQDCVFVCHLDASDNSEINRACKLRAAAFFSFFDAELTSIVLAR